MVLFSLTSVQTQFAKHITQNINARYDTDISIYKIQLKLNGKVYIEDVLVQDHHNDTLLFIKEFKTSIQGLDRFLNRDFDFNYIELDRVFLNLKKYPNELESSIQIFISELKKNPDFKKSPFTFKSEYIKLINSQIVVNDLNKGDSKKHYDKIDLTLRNFDFDSEKLNVAIESLQANSDEYGEINKFQTEIKYAPDSVSFSDFLFEFNKNKIKGEGVITFEGKDLTNIEALKFDVMFSETSINLGSISFLKPFINKSLVVNTDLKLFGKPNDFKAELRLSDKNQSSIEGDVQIKNFFNSKKELFISDNIKIQTSNSALKLAIHDSIYQRFGQFIELEDKVELQSNFHITDTKVDLDVSMETEYGSMFPKINASRLTKQQGWEYVIDLDLESFNVGKLLDEKNFGLLTGTISNKGVYDSTSPFLNEFIGNITQAWIGGKEINNVEFSGVNSEENIKARVSTNEEENQFDFQIEFDQAQEFIEIKGKIENFDLSTYGFVDVNSEIAFSSKAFRFNKRKMAKDKSQYKLEIESPKISSNIGSTVFDDLIINALSDKGKQSILVENSDAFEFALKGEFEYQNIKKLIDNMVDNLFFVKPVDKKKQDLGSFRFNFQMKSKLTEALFPNLLTPKNLFLSGVISSDIRQTSVVFDIPTLSFEDYTFTGLHFEMDPSSLIYNSFLSASAVQLNKLKINDLYMISTSIYKKDKIRIEGTLGDIASNNFEANLSYNRDGQKSVINFELLNIHFKEALWLLKNKEDSKVVFDNSSNVYNVESLVIQNENQLIGLEGSFNSIDNFHLNGYVQNVLFHEIFPATKKFDIQGKLNSKVDFYKTSLKRDAEINLSVSNLIINTAEMGDLELVVKGNTDTNSYKNNVKLIKNGDESLTGEGITLISDDRITLDMDVSLDAFDLSFLSTLGKGKLTNIRSLVTGEINFWGPIDEISHTGSAIVNNFNISVPYTNTSYRLAENAQVTLYDQVMQFEPIQVFDGTEETFGNLKARISHIDFLKWNLDLNITSNRLLLINRLNNKESLFYGTGYLDGEINLTGPMINLTLDLQGATAEGTSIKIPWEDKTALADISFIDFVSKSSLTNSNTLLLEQQPVKINIPSGFEMNFDLDINNKAEVEIVVNQESKSNMIGRGAGNLLMEINTDGKFNIWGDFIIDDGVYNFKDLGFLEKKFKVNPGGTIIWEGDLADAQLNIEAIYQVPSGANPAILIDNPNFNRKIPTDVLIQIQGSLLKPSNPSFEINFPNTDGILASEINYRLADEQRRHMQAISLLSQGVFINDISFSTDGLTNNFYEKASELFNSIMEADNNKFNVGLNYLKGDRQPNLSLQSEDRIGITFASQISDKILFNGKVGVPVGGVQETAIVGNVQIDFILNDEGTLRAKVFNRENEFRYINDDLGYTQGLGLSYQIDFKTFKDLIRKTKEENTSKNDILPLGSPIKRLYE